MNGPERSHGEVWLVGAGPGDPGLLTVRGRELLGAADVVVTDRLVSTDVLGYVRPEAEIVYSGKSAGALTRTQEGINALLVERALAGRRVVRLKGGDPFLLGRGGEEAEACRLAGVRCTVVPGVPSAFAAPAYAGIPVTHRGVAQDVAVVSGHLRPGHPDSTVDWAALGASRMTIVVLMGVARLADVTAALIEGGRSPDTPVAVIERATTPAQRVVRGTLDTIVVDAVARGVRSPAVVVIGDVAARHDAVPRILPPPDSDNHGCRPRAVNGDGSLAGTGTGTGTGGNGAGPSDANNRPDRATVRPRFWNGAGPGDTDSPDGDTASLRNPNIYATTDSCDDSRGFAAGSPAVDAGAGRPLAGVRVLVPRTRPRPGLLATRLRALGADAVESTVSRPGPVADPAPLLAALTDADALVLAGVAEVAAVVALLRRAGHDIRALAGLVLVAADAEAEVALEALGLACVRPPVSACDAGPAGSSEPADPRGAQPRTVEPTGTQRAGSSADVRGTGSVGARSTESADVRSTEPSRGRDRRRLPLGSGVVSGSVRVVVCASASPPAGAETVRRISLLTDVDAEPDPRIVEEIRHGDLHAVAFASSTAVRATVALYGSLPDGIMVAAIGRRTVEACRHAGVRVDAVATEPGIHPLAAAVADAVTRARSAEASASQRGSVPKSIKNR
ncbi:MULTISPECIES: uroporphyrinogen-III C-methyltransferase [Protofrankia]|uniref:uroporphyrinogen-III C-methyltransferase n=1 Tax=Candidatus Protofrankia datiscae TaxID=2716812 RepID=F8AVI3_9ACTN|nr:MULTISPECIES: uroporphyrinogen-III C-methyltransferase [Protofrankia]AEH11289.1 uroporphyrin-III C-methyltransferase [Candidatus Protofrankia datiscae]